MELLKIVIVKRLDGRQLVGWLMEENKEWIMIGFRRDDRGKCYQKNIVARGDMRSIEVIYEYDK